MVVRGIGAGCTFMPAMTAAFASLKREELPDATPQMHVVMRVGGSIGTAVLAVVLQRARVGAAHARQTPTTWRSGGRSASRASRSSLPSSSVRSERAARRLARRETVALPVGERLAESAA